MKTRKLTSLALLTSMSLIIFIIESQIPPLAPIPGIKLGLANVITMVTMKLYGRKDAFIVLIMRIILASVFTGQMISFIYSLSGGLLCFAVMSIVNVFLKDEYIWVMSVFGAVAHSIGQIITAVLVTSTIQITAYLPILMISSIITGVFTGLTAGFLVKNYIIKTRRKSI